MVLFMTWTALGLRGLMVMMPGARLTFLDAGDPFTHTLHNAGPLVTQDDREHSAQLLPSEEVGVRPTDAR